MDIARITITLLDVQPPVRRVIEVPIAITLADLHVIIQAAMGWQDSHLYEFHMSAEYSAHPALITG
jgi:Plasmid pRiA4b ORF-3-like protein